MLSGYLSEAQDWVTTIFYMWWVHLWMSFTPEKYICNSCHHFSICSMLLMLFVSQRSSENRFLHKLEVAPQACLHMENAYEIFYMQNKNLWERCSLQYGLWDLKRRIILNTQNWQSRAHKDFKSSLKILWIFIEVENNFIK